MRRPLLFVTLLLALVAIPIMSSSPNHVGAGILVAQEAQPAQEAPPAPAAEPRQEAQPEMPPAPEPRQAQDFPLPGEAEIDVDINEAGGAWYENPVWVAIGALALVVLIVLVVMATRGGGTATRV
jgi:hypothetical protein